MTTSPPDTTEQSATTIELFFDLVFVFSRDERSGLHRSMIADARGRYVWQRDGVEQARMRTPDARRHAD